VVGCPISEANIKLFGALQAAGVPGYRAEEASLGAAALNQLLNELHLPFGFLYEEGATAAQLARYELVVLPNLPYISPTFGDALRQYVEEGGNLLAIADTSLREADGTPRHSFALADLCGVDFVETSPYSVVYLDRLNPIFSRTVPAMPLLLKDLAGGRNPDRRALRCRPQAGTRVLGYLTDPVLESDFAAGYHIYHQHAPPGALTEYPALTICTRGRGKVVYCAAPFLHAFSSVNPDVGRSPHLKEVLRVLLEEELRVGRRLRVQAPASVRMVLREDAEGWLLHLLHLPKESDSMYVDATATAPEVEVQAAPGWSVAAVCSCLSGRELPVSREARGVSFRVPPVTDHTIVRIARSPRAGRPGDSVRKEVACEIDSAE